MSRITVSVWRCGGCGKKRGLHHLCPGGRGRRQRDRISLKVEVRCRHCGQPAPNPITHTCTVRTDWKKRQAAQKRRAAAEKRKQTRRNAAARKRARAKERRRVAAEKRKQAAAAAAARRKARQRQRSHDGTRHDYETCADSNCPNFRCRIYKEGVQAGDAQGRAEGLAAGFAEGYDKGFPDGFAAGAASAAK